MDSEKKIFLSFSHYNLWELMTPGRGQFGHQELDWQNLCRGPLNIATYSIYKLWASWFQRRRVFSITSLLGANDPQGVASLDPMGLIGRTYVVDQYTLLHTKYISSGPHGFREEDFLSFSNYKSMAANDLRGMASLDPRSMVCRIYVGDH